MLRYDPAAYHLSFCNGIFQILLQGIQIRRWEDVKEDSKLELGIRIVFNCTFDTINSNGPAIYIFEH